jgi:hypothetical protein
MDFAGRSSGAAGLDRLVSPLSSVMASARRAGALTDDQAAPAACRASAMMVR